jgi:hypothetical protein
LKAAGALVSAALLTLSTIAGATLVPRTVFIDKFGYPN